MQVRLTYVTRNRHTPTNFYRDLEILSVLCSCTLYVYSETFSSSLAKARFKLGSQGRQVGYKVAAISVRVQSLLCAERREEADTGAHPGTRPAEWIWMLDARARGLT